MSLKIKVIGSIIVIGILLIIMLAIECGYIQYGLGHVHFEHPKDFQRHQTERPNFLTNWWGYDLLPPHEKVQVCLP